MAVCEYQNQGIFNMTLCDGDPSLSYWHLLLVSKQKTVVFGILKASHSLTPGPLPQKNVILKMTCFWYSKNDVFVWIPKASINMTTRFLRKKTVILTMTWIWYSKTTLLMTHAVKVVTASLKVVFQCAEDLGVRITLGSSSYHADLTSTFFISEEWTEQNPSERTEQIWKCKDLYLLA
jgi:hypothetical protein